MALNKSCQINFCIHFFASTTSENVRKSVFTPALKSSTSGFFELFLLGFKENTLNTWNIEKGD